MFQSTLRSCLAAGVALAAASAALPALALNISSSANDLSASLNAGGVASVTIGPINPVGGSAPPAYSVSNTVASVTVSNDLSTLGVLSSNLGATTGVLSSSASSPFTPTPTGTATATVNGLNLNLSASGLAPLTLLSLSATTVTSTTSVSGFGSLQAHGSSSIEGLTLNGSLIGLGALSGVTYINPPANDVIFDAGGLEVILNQQIPLGGGVGLQTNAIAVLFNDVPLGVSLVDGSIDVATSQALISGAPAPAPEPASWVMMLSGAALCGAMLRRQRVLRQLT